MLSLGINIDHVATLRQQRGTEYPNPLQAAELALQAGADGITLHLREDRRHIQDSDVYALREMTNIRMNLECAITQEMLDIACVVQPHAVCLVPERREELTTEGGLDVQRHFDSVQAAVQMLQNKGIQVSLFIDPEEVQIQAARATGAPVIELHTGAYAEASSSTREQELQRIEQAAVFALDTGLCVHAGHGLHYQNVMDIAVIPAISELNIGHAIVAQSIFDGWIPAVRFMKILMLMSKENKELAQYYGMQLSDFSFAGTEARIQLMQWYDAYMSSMSNQADISNLA